MSTSRSKRKQAIGYDSDPPCCGKCAHYQGPRDGGVPLCGLHVGMIVKPRAVCDSFARKATADGAGAIAGGVAKRA